MALSGRKAELFLEGVDKAFGMTVGDFLDGKPIYTKWGTEENHIDLEDLGDHSFKLSKNLGDIYIDKIKTDNWIIVGKGTTLHCDDMHAGKGVELDFDGYLM